MRKSVKKVVAAATVLTMTAAMSVSAFAAACGSYTLVGAPRLFGCDEDANDDIGWITNRAEQQLKDDDGDGIYVGTFTCAADGEFEYKVVGDGELFAWNFQLCLGNPDTTWADNQSQFKGNFKAGDYTVVVDPAQGFVACVQNGAVVDFTVRYKSRDEDSANFVEPSQAGITADGYADVPAFDAAFADFKTKAVSLAPAATTPETEAPTEAPTQAATEAPTTAAGVGSEGLGGATEATTASKPVQTGDAIPVAAVAALVAAAGVAVVASKKKEA